MPSLANSSLFEHCNSSLLMLTVIIIIIIIIIMTFEKLGKMGFLTTQYGKLLFTFFQAYMNHCNE